MRARRLWRRGLLVLALVVIALGGYAFWLEPAGLTVADERLVLASAPHGTLPNRRID